MSIVDLATTQVISVREDSDVDTAIALMEEHDIHHLPVVAPQGDVAGLLSDRDILLGVGWLRSAERRLPDGTLAGPRRVGEIMTKRVICSAPEASRSAAAGLLLRQRIHALPLVEHDALVGIVTVSDMLQGIVSAPEFTSSPDPLCERSIRSLLTKKLRTVGPRLSFDDVAELMLGKRIRHLPVTIAGELLGIVSDRDVRRALGLAMIRDEQAQAKGEFYMGPSMAMEIMCPLVKTIEPSARLGRAVSELLEHRIHCLPVVEDGLLQGIITDTDILGLVSLETRVAGCAVGA